MSIMFSLRVTTSYVMAHTLAMAKGMLSDDQGLKQRSYVRGAAQGQDGAQVTSFTRVKSKYIKLTEYAVRV